MRRFVAFLVLPLAGVLWCTPSFSADPVILRAQLEPEAGIWVGQQVQLDIDVLGLDGWATIERLPHLEVPGAQVLRVETQGVRLSETIEGGSYTGQRYQWLVFPQRTGAINVPAVPVQVTLKTFGVGVEPQVHALETPPVGFEAAIPPGAEDIPGLISTSELKVTQTWSPTETRLAAGDGIQRRILLEADAVAGMAFAPLSHSPIEGLAIYPGEPEVADQVERGELVRGERVETVTYVPERAGEFRLPDLSYRWWDIEGQVLKEEVLEGVTLEVSPAPTFAEDAQSTQVAIDDRGGLKWLVVALVGAALVVGLVWVWRSWLAFVWSDYRERRRESESAYFNRFVDAAGTGDPERTLSALMRWIDRLDLPRFPARLETFAADYGDEQARHESRCLVATVARDSNEEKGWNGRRLVSSMKAARKRYLNRREPPGRASLINLPPLNPANFE